MWSMVVYRSRLTPFTTVERHSSAIAFDLAPLGCFVASRTPPRHPRQVQQAALAAATWDLTWAVRPARTRTHRRQSSGRAHELQRCSRFLCIRSRGGPHACVCRCSSGTDLHRDTRDGGSCAPLVRQVIKRSARPRTQHRGLWGWITRNAWYPHARLGSVTYMSRSIGKAITDGDNRPIDQEPHERLLWHRQLPGMGGDNLVSVENRAWLPDTHWLRLERA